MKTPWGTRPGEDVRKLLWYAASRERHAELRRKLRHRLDHLAERVTRVPARAQCWCVDVAVAPRDAVRRLAGTELTSFSEGHPALWQAAAARVEARPVGLGGGASVDVLYALVRALRPRRVLETGVANGWSALAILTALDENGEGALVSTDLPGVVGAEALVGRAVGTEGHPRWTLLRRGDREALPEALRLLGGVDLFHYDSDKSTEGRLAACRVVWPALAEGGLLLSDDINDNFGFRDFCREVARAPLVFRGDDEGTKYVGAIVK